MNIPEETKPRRISYSAMKSFDYCPKEYECKYVLGMHPTGHNSAFAMGSAVHSALIRYRHGDVVSVALTAAAMTLSEYQGVAEDDAARTAMLIRAYYRRWADEPIRATHAETEVRRHLGGAWSCTGYIDDVVFDLQGGIPCLYELKTTSQSIREAEVTLRVDPQIHLYQALLRQQYALETRGCMLDIIKKPWSGKVKPRQAESTEEYCTRAENAMLADPDTHFKRVMVDYDGQLADAAMSAAMRTVASIERCEVEGFHALHGMRCKTPYGRWCDYRPHCWYNDASKYTIKGAKGDGKEKERSVGGDGNNEGDQKA
jgi:hypothetical protein